MTLATLLIFTGIACLVTGLALPALYALRMRLVARQVPAARARLVGATGAVSGMGPR